MNLLSMFLWVHVWSLQGHFIYPMDQWIITSTNAISIPLPVMVLTALQERSPTHDASKSTGILQPHGPWLWFLTVSPPECWQLSLLPHIIRSPSVQWSAGAAFCTQSSALPGDVPRGTRGEVLETQGGGWRAGSVARKFLKRGSFSETKRGHFISIHANLW